MNGHALLSGERELELPGRPAGRRATSDRTFDGSTMAKRWMIPAASPDCEGLARRLRVRTIIAQVLVNRGLSVDGAGEAFLSPQLKDLHAPALLPGAVEAAA